MTATRTEPSLACVPTAVRPQRRVTGPRVLRSEWAKLWSLHSTWIALGLALVAMLGIGTIAAFRYRSVVTSGQPLNAGFVGANAISLTLFGVGFGQLALGALGVLFSAGEYSSGSIRATLTAVPRRLPVLWSKAAVYAVVAFAVSIVGAVGGFLVVDAVLSGTDAHMSLTDPGVMRSLAGAALYLSLVGVISVGLGFILRSVAGGISGLVAILLLLPGLITLLPTSLATSIAPYLPSNAGDAIYALHQDPALLSPGNATLVLLGWTILALAGSAWQLASKDA
jgi:ABC-2 type transport system permease protein